MGKPGPSGTQKRRADATVEENVSKRVLKTNRFAVLAESVEKKERCPPFYTKGFPEELYSKLDYYVKQGLQKAAAPKQKATKPSKTAAKKPKTPKPKKAAPAKKAAAKKTAAKK
ncbi:histone H1-I-like [Aedes aegypti]|uniref:Uncharacterized protein n=1 Tax=Aedes aegypti TaxID=7159 RepID=A0A6I8TZU2_AEDAE|nr:histone H1-I-like [Aedes aegypti]